SFQDRYSLKGSVVGAVDLVRGMGICAGLTPVTVTGATGSIVTNFAGKTKAALDELKRGQDFVYLHIESPDEAGHQGSLKDKIWSIEQIDREVLGMVMAEMEHFSELRVMILPDHPTPIAIKTHSSEPVPFMIFDKNKAISNGLEAYNEITSSQGPFIAKGHELMELFIKG
ncbi:MAG: phosphoglycerate mutase, partial [Syntrophomonadaceae bacterium]|nr:phosphoglycerate mutase [Syntrophomonadaceae bacterium]